MERAAGIHGHVVGLRQDTGHAVRPGESDRTAGGMRYGYN